MSNKTSNPGNVPNTPKSAPVKVVKSGEGHPSIKPLPPKKK